MERRKAQAARDCEQPHQTSPPKILITAPIGKRLAAAVLAC